MHTLRLLRVAGLSFLTLLLWTIPRRTKAQYSNICDSFVTYPIDCPSCCSKASNSVEDAINASVGDGTDTIGSMTLSCGTPASCGGVACGDQDIPVPAQNPSCFTSCSYRNQPCYYDSDCCDDFICSTDGLGTGTCQSYY